MQSHHSSASFDKQHVSDITLSLTAMYFHHILLYDQQLVSGTAISFCHS